MTDEAYEKRYQSPAAKARRAKYNEWWNKWSKRYDEMQRLKKLEASTTNAFADVNKYPYMK